METGEKDGRIVEEEWEMEEWMGGIVNRSKDGIIGEGERNMRKRWETV